MTDEKARPPDQDDSAAIRQSFSVIGAELCNVLHRIAPAEAQQHFKSAHVEALKGIRVLIDKRIERLSSDSSKKGTSITVE